MEKQNEKRMQYIVAFLFVFMFILAVTSAVIGVLVPEMQKDYDLTYDRISYLSAVQNVGGFITVLFGGILADRFDKLKLIGICAFFYTVCLLFSGMIPPYFLLLVLFFIIGAMCNMESVLVSAYISDLYKEKAFSYLNLSHGFFGAGSLIGPTYATLLFSLNLKWTVLYQTLAVTCGGILIFYCVFQRKIERIETEKKTKEHADKKEVFKIIKKPQAMYLCVACCIYMGQQTSLNTWITSFSLNSFTTSTALAGLTTSGYWLGITFGRFLQSALTAKFDSVKCTMWGCIVGAVLLGTGFISGNITILMAMVFISATCSGAAYPNMIGAMGKLLPEMTGAGTSALCIAGTFGGIIFPWISAKLISISYLAGMMLCPIAMAVTALLLKLYMGKEI